MNALVNYKDWLIHTRGEATPQEGDKIMYVTEKGKFQKGIVTKMAIKYDLDNLLNECFAIMVIPSPIVPVTRLNIDIPYTDGKLKKIEFKTVNEHNWMLLHGLRTGAGDDPLTVNLDIK